MDGDYGPRKNRDIIDGAYSRGTYDTLRQSTRGGSGGDGGGGSGGGGVGIGALIVIIVLGYFWFWRPFHKLGEPPVPPVVNQTQTLRLTPYVYQGSHTVLLNGMDLTKPQTPFKFEWGDGTASIGLFRKRTRILSQAARTRFESSQPTLTVQM
jgi:hypothetical protein